MFLYIFCRILCPFLLWSVQIICYNVSVKISSAADRNNMLPLLVTAPFTMQNSFLRSMQIANGNLCDGIRFCIRWKVDVLFNEASNAEHSPNAKSCTIAWINTICYVRTSTRNTYLIHKIILVRKKSHKSTICSANFWWHHGSCATVVLLQWYDPLKFPFPKALL